MTSVLLMKSVPAPTAFTGDVSNLLDSVGWVCYAPRIWNFFCQVKVQYWNVKSELTYESLLG